MNAAPISLKLEAGVSLADEDPLFVAASVWLPVNSAAASTALVCLAGGNMNSRYYDLQVEGDESFSFATQMTARGFIVIALDHLGLGQSSKPVDGYVLTPELLARANGNVTAEILKRLRDGSLSFDAPALPNLQSIGVGHSMGAMLTVLQQADWTQHRGIALLGFSTRGLPQFVPPDVRELAADPGAVRARLVEFARRMFVSPYPVIRTSAGKGGNNVELYGSANADPRGVAALKQATDCLLPVSAFLSMIPGNVASEAAQITVPVLLMLGERDMAGEPGDAPAAFMSSRAVSLQVLPATGHSHFLFESRTLLFDRLAQWAEGVAATPN